MSRRTDGSLPLPSGWEVGYDFDLKPFYIDHKTKTTSWVDPRDRVTKPLSFADCVGDELPFGWEECYDLNVGAYYINHNTQENQLEDPRYEWRRQQEQMLTEYLSTAHEELAVKKEIISVKQEQLNLAEDEFRNLNESLANWKSSRTSLNSAASVSSSKHDPDLLRTEVALAKTRVSRLKRELDQIQTEMRLKEDGLKTLQQVNEKMTGQQYSISEATAILNEIHKIKLSLMSGEKEKKELMESLARLKDDFLLGKFQDEASIDVYSSIDRCPTVSQTDLTVEFASVNARVSEMSRVRAEYDDARKRLTDLQKTLAHIEDSATPGQKESDRDRLMLIQEKEQLLRELRALSTKGKDARERNDVLSRIDLLQRDLNLAAEMSSRQISDRLRMHEDRHDLVRRLAEAAKQATRLESQLRCLSMGSLSSSSSLGSLSSLGGSSLPSSSRGSLNSSSYSDLYAQSSRASSETSLPDLHRRVEKLLQGQSVASPASPLSDRDPQNLKVAAPSSVAPTSVQATAASAFPPPTYEQHMNGIGRQKQRHTAAGGSVGVAVAGQLDERQLQSRLSELSLLLATQPDSTGLAPISERESSLVTAAAMTTCRTSGVSAAVSDESVAGDSGVFEASMQSRRGELGYGALSGGSGRADSCAEVQIKLKYEGVDGCLHIGVEQARNVAALLPLPQSSVCIKATLLPPVPNAEPHFTTSRSQDLDSPKFNEEYTVRLSEGKVALRTLSVSIFSLLPDSGYEECLGCVQLSLADFNPNCVSTRWYNVLSSKFTHNDQAMSKSLRNEFATDPSLLLLDGSSGPESLAQLRRAGASKFAEATAAELLKNEAVAAAASRKAELRRLTGFGGRRGSSSSPTLLSQGTPSLLTSSGVCMEESSDESTVVSGSQASTLTRVQGAAAAAALYSDHIFSGNGDMRTSSKEGTPAESIVSSCSDCASSSLSSDVTDGGFGGGENGGSRAYSTEELSPLSDFSYGGGSLSSSSGRSAALQSLGYSGTNTQAYSSHAPAATTRVLLAQSRSQPAYPQLLSAAASATWRTSASAPDTEAHFSIRRSQTFSSTTAAVPAPTVSAADLYICKLNRSDSDSSMHKRSAAAAPFLRGTYERRSLRFKQQQQQQASRGSNSAAIRSRLQPTAAQRKMAASQQPRTSIDLELDLQASHVKLSQQQEEINRLRDLKKKMEEALAKGDKEPPTWFSDEQLQKLLASADKLIGKNEPLSLEDAKIEKLVHKLLKQVDKYRRLHKRDPDSNTFREKMAFFTTRRSITVPTVADCDGASDCGMAALDGAAAVAAGTHASTGEDEWPRSLAASATGGSGTAADIDNDGSRRPRGSGLLAGSYLPSTTVSYSNADMSTLLPQSVVPPLNLQQLLEIEEEEELL